MCHQLVWSLAHCHTAPRLSFPKPRRRPTVKSAGSYLSFHFSGVGMSAFALIAPLGALLVSFLGLPIATPPAKEDPLMARVAPADCVAYASWAARAEPSARSNNQTEQLLAEPEVQAFAANLQRNILGAAIAAAKANGAPPEQTENAAAAIDLFVQTVFTRSGAAFISRLEPKNNGVDFQAGVLINGG